MIYRFFRIVLRWKMFAAGVLLLLVGIWLMGLLCAAFPQKLMKIRLQMLSDYDYLSEISELYYKGKLSEAKELIDFVYEECDGVKNNEIVSLRKEIHVSYNSFLKRAVRTSSGFLIGDGESKEELMGAIVSDMVLYGDIRDLVKQGYYKCVGKPTDYCIAALSAVGIVTEFIDVVDWGPAILKTAKKVGALSRKFCDFLVQACKRSVKAKRMDGKLVTIFKDVNRMNKTAGVSATVKAMEYVNSAEDLSVIRKQFELSPIPTLRLLEWKGIAGVRALSKISENCCNGFMMNLAAKKGRPGFVVLQSFGRKLRYLERSIRMTPLVGKYGLKRIIESPQVCLMVLFLSIFSIVSGILCVYKTIFVKE